MQKTKIEWADYVWNPVKGECPQGCKRDPKLRLDQKELYAFFPKPEKPTRIFVGSTIDLLHEKIPSDWINRILSPIKFNPEKTFIFLTKNPARYAEFDFPGNCWLGVTVTGWKDNDKMSMLIRHKSKKNLIFISYEPMLTELKLDWQDWENFKWIICGALTGSKARIHKPNWEWIEYMRFGAKNWNIPIFMKDNLQKVWGQKLIQQFPKARGVCQK